MDLISPIQQLPALTINRKKLEKVIIYGNRTENQHTCIILTVNFINSHKILCCIEANKKQHNVEISSGTPYFLPTINDGFIIYSPCITLHRLKLWYDNAQNSKHFCNISCSQARIVFKLPKHYTIVREEIFTGDINGR